MLKNYLKAARLRTLPLSIAGIIVGSILGNHDIYAPSHTSVKTPVWESLLFWLAILTTIGFQILSNFANDYGDGIKGTDNHREGEERLVASGTVTPKQMKRAIIVTAILTISIALWLIYTAFGKNNFEHFMLFFLLGIAAMVAAIKYTIGKSAYGYSGYGDLFVFLFFGLLSVAGSYFLFAKELTYTIFLPAFSVGLLSVAVLNLNNMRDRNNDQLAGKNTLVVKMGPELAKYYHYYLLIASLLFALLYTAIQYQNPKQFLFLIAYIPLTVHFIFVIRNKEEKRLDGELKKVALSTFLFAILFGLGQVL
ncbi:MAG: 1,4-dihydroxy-2-naphthoate octaprenyltransferase [Flavobacteriaceae bacterium]|nr:MAG: 1,4-dihydroxy-2-naphthoate octaprenyltransferase [Flavobacteriaceae bacterium]